MEHEQWVAGKKVKLSSTLCNARVCSVVCSPIAVSAGWSICLEATQLKAAVHQPSATCDTGLEKRRELSQAGKSARHCFPYKCEHWQPPIAAAMNATCSPVLLSECHSTDLSIDRKTYRSVSRDRQCCGREVQCQQPTKTNWTKFAHHTHNYTSTLYQCRLSILTATTWLWSTVTTNLRNRRPLQTKGRWQKRILIITL